MRPERTNPGARIYGPFGVSRDPRLEVLSVTRGFAYGMTLLALAFFVAVALFLVVQSLPSLRGIGISFLTDGDWFYPRHEFGALSMLYGTIVVSTVAMILAVPFGVGSAIFVAEYLPPRGRVVIKGLLELLAGIPSVVYGLLGVVYLQGFLFAAFSFVEPGSGDSLFAGGVLLAVMILPTVATLSEDALRSVGKDARERARALGFTKWETIRHAVLPPASRGIVGAVLLGTGRALGETIAVFLVVGRADGRLPSSLFDFGAIFNSGQTLTSKLGGTETNIAYGDPLHWGAIVELGLLLFVLVIGITLVGELLTLWRKPR